jgi:type IV secretory pathway protease TraF
MSRSGPVTAICVAALGVGLSVLSRPTPKLICQRQRADRPLRRASRRRTACRRTAVVMPPEPLATFLDERIYLPKGVRLLKHVLALPGQTVCRFDRAITVDGVAVGEALDRDHLSRPRGGCVHPQAGMRPRTASGHIGGRKIEPLLLLAPNSNGGRCSPA